VGVAQPSSPYSVGLEAGLKIRYGESSPRCGLSTFTKQVGTQCATSSQSHCKSKAIGTAIGTLLVSNGYVNENENATQ
jgi:hypothetical protein